MGAWGYKIKENDTTLDVINTVMDLMREGLSFKRASALFHSLPEWREVLDDGDERALINLGLAEVAWSYDKVPTALLKAVKADFAAERALTGWSDPIKRTRAVENFIAKISKPNHKPKAPPKPETTPQRLRSPGFTTGDCLAVKLKDGRYGAAYIVQAVQPEKGKGYNIVVELDYLATSVPSIARFKELKPLVLTHHEWDHDIQLQKYPCRDKHVDEHAEVIGNLDLRWPNIKLQQDGHVWINWGAKPHSVARKMASILGKEIGEKDPMGRYLPFGAWDLGSQILMQEQWDKDKKKRNPSRRK